jgi:glycosyltransferase involved in cell wall biosynthesis
MKIILVHNKYKEAGGEDLVFWSEGELLAAHGHQVEYMLFDNREIKTTIDKWLSGIKVIYNPASSKRLRQSIETFRPDIIHVHNFVPLASPSIFFTAKKYNIPVVATLHNYRLICPGGTLFYDHSIYEKSIHTDFPWDAIIKGIYRNSSLQTAALTAATRLHNRLGTWRDKVDKFIVLTDFAKKKFKDSILKTSPDAFVVKPNFVVDRGIGQPDREDFFLYAGRLIKEKGIETLLESTKIFDYKLTIIGDGPMRREVEHVAETNANVSYLGFQSTEVIVNYLKKCKALIFPSTWYEGFPMIILEAFSTGTPVIASRLGAMEEIVQHNVNGLHVNPGEADDLVDKLKRAMTETDLMRRLSMQARAIYLTHYTPRINYDFLINIYTQVLSGKRMKEFQSQ